MGELMTRWLRWMHTLVFTWVDVRSDFKKVGRAAKLAANLFGGLLIRAALILVLPLSALVIAYFDLRDERKRKAKSAHFGG